MSISSGRVVATDVRQAAQAAAPGRFWSGGGERDLLDGLVPAPLLSLKAGAQSQFLQRAARSCKESRSRTSPSQSPSPPELEPEYEDEDEPDGPGKAAPDGRS